MAPGNAGAAGRPWVALLPKALAHHGGQPAETGESAQRVFAIPGAPWLTADPGGTRCHRRRPHRLRPRMRPGPLSLAHQHRIMAGDAGGRVYILAVEEPGADVRCLTARR